MTSDRIACFVARMHIRASDRVLEIGCGHGVAAALICAMLTSGHYTAFDRSAKMIAAARQRNAAAVRDGQADFLIGALETIDLGSRRFDKILAMRVGLFHRDPTGAGVLAKRWLAPQGRLFVQYDEP